jgi:hypothetical protein
MDKTKEIYLVLIETSGNQRFIFATNKLRENVGASELTYRIGTEVVRQIADGQSNVKPIITASGKALLMADSENQAKTIVREVTKKALEEMPGLTIHGAICKVEDEKSAESLHKAIGDVHRRLEEIRHQMPSNLQRFQRLPFVAQCSTSNLPASAMMKFETEPRPYSKVSAVKADKKEKGYKRITEKLREADKDLNGLCLIVPDKIGEPEWLAVIHADGNGLGEVFLNFYERSGSPQTRGEYIEKYRKFSEALDQCTIAATAAALKKFRASFIEEEKAKAKKRGKELSTEDIEKIELPFIPLVLGGDDLTVICDGRYALKFTCDFLRKFEQLARQHDDIKDLIKLGACAGIAIVKPHYPFHQAYELAEQLLQSAKMVKRISPSLSALDYHVLYDSGGTSLDEIREKTPFVARPYVVTPKETAKSYKDNSAEQTWIENHHFCKLAKRVKAINARDDDGKRRLPNSQLHVLREGLFIDEAEAEARADLIKHRYADKGFNDLLCNGKLFFEDKFDGKTKRSTHFLDSLEIAEFFK